MNQESLDSQMIARAFGLKAQAVRESPTTAPVPDPQKGPSLAGGRSGGWQVWTVWAIFALELLGILAAQLPGVADFQKFGFYDEGSWLELDRLFAAGKMPTIDVGYSYGMLPLILGRGWFALFGRTPWAFIGFVTTCNLIAAWGVARILDATGGLTWKRVLLACLVLPYAIFPNNYSLMHPLEMMLIVLGLAELARGRYGGALAMAVLAALAKPTMGYVLGFLVIVAIALGWKKVGWKGFLLAVALAAGVAMLGVGGEILVTGWRPVVNNLLPLTGGGSYRAMHFGIFDAGKAFWWHPVSAKGLVQQVQEVARYYFLTPAGFWLVGSFFVWAMGIGAIVRSLSRKKQAGSEPWPACGTWVMVVLAILHAVFVFAFFAWSRSWTYYSYLLVLGVMTGIAMLRGRWRTLAAAVFVLLAGMGLTERFGDVQGRWRGMMREAEGWGLWYYPDFRAEAEEARERVQEKHGLFLTNGALPMMWPDVEAPRVWFLSPGIQTAGEMEAIREELQAAGAVVICKDYDQNQEAWNWPELAKVRDAFEAKPDWDGKDFQVYLKKKREGAQADVSLMPPK